MLTTFPQLLLKHAAERPTAPALREKEYGIWQTHSWADLARLVETVAAGLRQAGLQRHEHMVVIGANRPRLYATMLAAQSLGAIPVPLYQDAVAAECIFPLNNAEVRFCLVEDQEQVDKMLEIREQCPQITRIFYDDPRGLRNYNEQGLDSLDALIESGTAFVAQNPGWFQAEVAKARPEDVAAMFFTSGTTGNPKGVVHTHSTLLDRASAGAEFDKLTSSRRSAGLPAACLDRPEHLQLRPVAGLRLRGELPRVGQHRDHRPQGSRPHLLLCAPPRIFEGLLTSVMIRMEDAGTLKRKMFEACMAVAKRVGPALMDGEAVSTLDRIKYALGNLLVYGPLRNNLGFSRVRVAYTAGEAIGPDLFTFYRSIGINLKQLYGSTETAVFVCLQPDNQARADTVGVPIRGVQIKVADNGEILVKSAGLLKEYYKNPAATAEVLTADGWYHTSDAGFLDAHGHLKIIDRVKDVGRIQGGANDGAMFAPKYVENKLKFFPHIKEVVALGDKREQVCVMVNIDFDAVGNWAERRNLPYAGYTDLAQKPEVYELIRECIEKVNADLATDAMLAGSQVSRFLVLHKELDADDGELTRTNKVRRGFIAEKYGVLVDALYAGRTEQYIETQVKFEDGRTGSVSATLKLSDTKTFAPVKSAA